MSDQWFFDPDNQGRSFYNGYGLLDEHGHPLGIFIETGGVFNDSEQRAKARLAAAAPDLLAVIAALFSNKHFCVGDATYLVRDHEGAGWDGPSVSAWGEAVMKGRELVDKLKGETA